MLQLEGEAERHAGPRQIPRPLRRALDADEARSPAASA